VETRAVETIQTVIERAGPNGSVRVLGERADIGERQAVGLVENPPLIFFAAEHHAVADADPEPALPVFKKSLGDDSFITGGTDTRFQTAVAPAHQAVNRAGNPHGGAVPAAQEAADGFMRQFGEGGLFHKFSILAKAQTAPGSHPEPASRIFLQTGDRVTARLAARIRHDFNPALPQTAKSGTIGANPKNASVI